ncbi:hypothetical protein F5B20DRAFT_529051 [Whalleya microplaca]|nr:hypothetical protein F5B20DRAFT_529051 [Whalleya microplaca]
MEAIKKWLNPKKKKKANKKQTSPPLNCSSSESLTDSKAKPTFGSATTTFTPEGRGRDATLAWLDTGRSEALVDLLQERDIAESQVRRGPKTKGTKEVQDILRKPSMKTIEYLHRVRRQAELTVRYGVPGAVAYNFSKSLGWNKIAASQLPPLEFRDFGAMMKEHRVLFSNSPRIPSTPPTPPTPIDWLDLGTSGPLCGNGRSLSPISEPGGWRDTPPEDIERPVARLGFVGDDECEDEEDMTLSDIDPDIERELDLYDYLSTTPNTDMTGDVGVVSEARILTVTPVSTRQVQEIYFQPRKGCRPKALSPILEASSVELTSDEE